MEIKETVKTVLLNHRKKVIEENFSELTEIRDINFLTEKFNEVFIKLLNEGYNPIEIQEFINEADIFPTSMEDYKNLDWTGKTHTPETIEKMKSQHKGTGIGKDNSQYGTCWITNGEQNKKIKKIETIPDGWKRGRKIG